MAVFISFGAIVINNLSNNSGMFFGENVQLGWDAPDKTNTALNIFGIGCCSFNCININSDPDLADTLTLHNNLNAQCAPNILKVT